MNKFLPLLFFVSFFLCYSCTDSDDDDGMSMQFEETQCENPWGDSSDSESYIVEVRAYLEDSGINVLSIYIDVYDEDAGENCNACNCVTGRNIVISLPPADVDKAKAIGFTIIE